MQLDEREQKLGAIWFFLAGPIGFVVILFLARVDIFLTYTDSEEKHAVEMAELRLAQTSLSSRSLDDRNSGMRAYREPQKTRMTADADTETHATAASDH